MSYGSGTGEEGWKDNDGTQLSDSTEWTTEIVRTVNEATVVETEKWQMIVVLAISLGQFLVQFRTVKNRTLKITESQSVSFYGFSKISQMENY